MNDLKKQNKQTEQRERLEKRIDNRVRKRNNNDIILPCSVSRYITNFYNILLKVLLNRYFIVCDT